MSCTNLVLTIDESPDNQTCPSLKKVTQYGTIKAPLDPDAREDGRQVRDSALPCRGGAAALSSR